MANAAMLSDEDLIHFCHVVHSTLKKENGDPPGNRYLSNSGEVFFDL